MTAVQSVEKMSRNPYEQQEKNVLMPLKPMEPIDEVYTTKDFVDFHSGENRELYPVASFPSDTPNNNCSSVLDLSVEHAQISPNVFGVSEYENNFNPNSTSDINNILMPNRANIFWQTDWHTLQFSNKEACNLAHTLLNVSNYFMAVGPNESSTSLQQEGFPAQPVASSAVTSTVTVSPSTSDSNASPLSSELSIPPTKSKSPNELIGNTGKWTVAPEAPKRKRNSVSKKQIGCAKKIAKPMKLSLKSVQHISPLLSPNSLSLEQIRAFNNYRSSYVPYCSICSAFSMRKLTGNLLLMKDWQSCEPMELPKSSPIWVRHR